VALAMPGGGRALRAGETALPAPSAAGHGEFTLVLAGDAIITQPWSTDRDPAFLALVDAIRGADVALVNLELVLNDFDTYAQADSGGGHMAARPAMAAELAWAGVDMVAHANNHTFDYGSAGVLKTLDSVAAAGLVLAGAGKDLQAARAPAYLRRPDATVALVATASTFKPYGKASRSVAGMPGRPGLNPLTATPLRYLEMPGFLARSAWEVAELLDLPRRRLDAEWTKLRGIPVRAGDGLGLERGLRVEPKDVEANLASVRKAAARAEIVVFSIHAHNQGAWLTDLAHRVIDAGADVFFAHGPHRMLGMEIYRGRPIFYGLGDFVFQPHRVERFPAEHYDRNGLGDDATVEDVRRRFVVGSPLYGQREPWEAVVAVLHVKEGRVRTIRLLPLDLRFGGPPASAAEKARLADDPWLGKPRLATGPAGHGILDRFGQASRPHGGVAVHYLDGGGAGEVSLDP
jgi:poly-gamma-glutamate synthesis protein (capsule biosynthesis protein)